jgi:hypothetical protein
LSIAGSSVQLRDQYPELFLDRFYRPLGLPLRFKTIDEKLETFLVPPNPQDRELEHSIIKKLFSQQQMKLGQTWYIVSSKWFKRWMEYTNYDGDNRHCVPKPGAIDNTVILEDSNTEGATTTEPRIKRNSMEGYDYELLPENVWLTLYSWYVANY